MGHARLSPSGASRWAACPGSLRLIKERGITDSSGMAAEEGTAAHELLEECLINARQPETYRGQFFNVGCKLQPAGWEADNDMIDAIQVAVDYIWSRMVQDAITHPMYPERKIDPGSMFGRTDCSGTADVTIIASHRIIILDYKHGRGIVVEVTDNLQAILYAIGVIAGLPEEQRAQITEVEIGIIQPRASHMDGPIRTMVYPIQTIYEWVEWFRVAAAATDHPDAPLVPGDKQCQFCPVKRHRDRCPAMQTKVLSAFEVQNINQLEPKVLRDPTTLSVQERALILDYADLIEQFVKAVKGQAQEDLQAGLHVPGQKLVRGKGGHKKFNIEDDKMIKRLSSSFGLKKNEIIAEPKLLGVAKILKLAKKSEKYSDEKYEKLEALVEQPPGKLTMAPESDPRPAAGSLRAKEAFKDVNLIN